VRVGELLAAAREEAIGDLTDGRLLELFLVERDEGAFAALVSRHGPMVLGVCRRVLGGGHDAEDAFLATHVVHYSYKGFDRRWLHGDAERVTVKSPEKARAVEVAFNLSGLRAEGIPPKVDVVLGGLGFNDRVADFVFRNVPSSDASAAGHPLFCCHQASAGAGPTRAPCGDSGWHRRQEMQRHSRASRPRGPNRCARRSPRLA
jgi:hypothetical protein